VVLALRAPTSVISVWVRNCGSAAVEIDAFSQSEWICLRGLATLIPDGDASPERLFRARFFERDLSATLANRLVEKLRVTITPPDGASLYGLAEIALNLSSEERDRRRAAGPASARAAFESFGGVVERQQILPDVRGKSPPKKAPQQPDESKTKKEAPKNAKKPTKKSSKKRNGQKHGCSLFVAVC
jgi:hypothetical protein